MSKLIYLTRQELNSIKEKAFSTNRVKQVSDVFLFSCMTGLTYVDLIRLSKDNFYYKDDILWVKINHAKTNLERNIPLNDIAVEILQKYKDVDNSILPLISAQKTNEYLKEIGAICNIEKNLSFTVARNTFAVFALTCGYSKQVVSKMLGHVQMKSMNVYLKAFNNEFKKSYSQKLG